MGQDLLLQAVGHRQRLFAGCGAAFDHTGPIDNSLREVASADALMIYSLLSTHVLGRMDASLREVHRVSHVHINTICRLYVKLSLDRVQRVLLVAHEVQRPSLECNLSICTPPDSISII